jgi:hypothetical protein
MNESNDVTMHGENVPEAMVASAVAAQPVAPGGSTAAITAAPVPPARRRGSKLARFFVILGIVLLSSVFVLPLLAEAMGGGSAANGWTLFFAVFYVAPFGLISFLLAIFAKLVQKLDEKEQGL